MGLIWSGGGNRVALDLLPKTAAVTLNSLTSTFFIVALSYDGRQMSMTNLFLNLILKQNEKPVFTLTGISVLAFPFLMISQ